MAVGRMLPWAARLNLTRPASPLRSANRRIDHFHWTLHANAAVFTDRASDSSLWSGTLAREMLVVAKDCGDGKAMAPRVMPSTSLNRLYRAARGLRTGPAFNP